MRILPETQALIDIANAYRKKQSDLNGGYVIINNYTANGWSLNISDSDKYLPGVWAIDETGNKYLSVGGNDYDGAESWQMIPHDTFKDEVLPLEDAAPRFVEQLINEFEKSSQTIDTYTLAVGLGSMAKQLAAFGKHAELVEKINKSLIKYEWNPSEVGCKLK